MQFEKDYIYHIYNQGNNRQKIFYNRENYLYFLQKIRTYILPYSDILAWCLMPNHFHLMVLIRHIELPVGKSGESLGVSQRHAETAHSDTAQSEKKRTFNSSIGIMLMSYTRAINKQQKRSGKLFREKTKSECVNCPKNISPSFIIKEGITKINIQNIEREYPKICFRYIHQNPVKAGLSKKETDWEFSSASDYAGLRNGKLVNKKIAIKIFED